MTCAAEPSAARPTLEVADIVRVFGEAFRRTYAITPDQAEVLRAITACRTSALGGHLDVCDACGYCRPAYNSCRNRHCPKCQALAQAAWIEKLEKRLLPVPHFHLVFTLPGALRRLAAFRRRELFDLLFAAASETLAELAATHLQARLGATLVLHTWTRDLRFHPHVHAIVTAGGLSLDGATWKEQTRFLFHVRVMGALLRGKVLDGLRALHRRGAFAGFDDFLDPEAFDRMMGKLASKRWVVYAKRPFGAADHVLRYLGRYTHRVGISNQRLLALRGDAVTFLTKDVATTTISGVQFLRRFTQHVLPKSFVKIRHYGLYAASNLNTSLAAARACFPQAPDAPLAALPDDSPSADTKTLLGRLTGLDVDRCPLCRIGTMSPEPLPPRLDSS